MTPGTRLADARAPLELWGGHECTVNRVGDRFYDQTVRTGHEHRIEDLDLFASLGIKALRYPVLWERVSPERDDQHDWRWTDQRLNRLRELDIAPIAGLCHHGSGPRRTHLLDAGFAPGLAAHARAVAERYPWLESYTPVNEPLTTARFAALYGHWYPHVREEGAFLGALLNEVEATILSMREVRSVNPAARLVQTEDLGHVFATDPVAHQAAFENERRWITFDLLCGRVTPDHVMWRFFESNGLGERVLRLGETPCPPDVIGLNYYLSSERFLDHRVDLYPPELRGGNGRDVYADVEAVRAVMPGVMGLERLLLLAHERYGLPLAVTEAHNGCTRDEQVRWLTEAWEACGAAREGGADVRALTVWSLLGSVDWTTLLTADRGEYEQGVFDVRSGEPRPTALADACRRLARGDAALPDHAQGPGWWSRDIRLTYAPTWAGQTAPTLRRWSPPAAPRRPVLIAGDADGLGGAFARACEHRGHAYRLVEPHEAAGALEAVRPWAVVDASGLERADLAEATARACAAAGAPLLAVSSDRVFDGAADGPHLEDAATGPGTPADLLAAERALLALGALVVRCGPRFAPLDPDGFAHDLAEALSRGLPFAAAADVQVSPTFTSDLVDAALNLLIDGETGVRHLANSGAVSRAEFAVRLACALGLDPDLVEPRPAAQLEQGAGNRTLASRYGALLPGLDEAVARHAAAVRPTLNVAPARALVRTPPLLRPRVGEPRSFAAAAEM